MFVEIISQPQDAQDAQNEKKAIGVSFFNDNGSTLWTCIRAILVFSLVNYNVVNSGLEGEWWCFFSPNY